jgi:hypothetical protein
MARTTLLAAVATAFLAIVASGCGSSGSSDEGVADLDTGAAAAAETPTTAQQNDEDPQEAALRWARCMREHGVDVPDPQVDSKGRVTVRAGSAKPSLDRSNDKFRQAVEACGNPLGNARPQVTEEQREQMQETMLSFARCMREHGIDMPDPEFSDGGGLFRAGLGRGVDPNDADFQAAQKACEPILQKLQGERKVG